MKTQRHFSATPIHMDCAPTPFFPFSARFWCLLGALAALALRPLPAQAAATPVTEMWVDRFSSVVSNSVDRALKVVSDDAGNIIVTGISNDNASGPDLLTIKYSGKDGSTLWQQRQRYNPLAYGLNNPGGEVAVAVALDRSGNVVVTGPTVDADSDSASDYYTAKYAAATGEVLWERRQHGQGYDSPIAMAVDGTGNVVVTGSATLKYAAQDGGLLWERVNDGPGKPGVFDSARALALDGDGNVVVTGMSFYRDTGNSDYYTAKYAANDGALLWEQRHNNSPAGFKSTAVAVDGSGNVVVTGSLWDSPSDGGDSMDYYTAKYAAASGTLLWEKRYNGPGIDSSRDEARALAVDASGNVVVTGSSNSAQGIPDYLTVKYAAADGAQLWERRFDGAASDSFDYGQALAMDKSGNVVVTGISSIIKAFGGIVRPFDYYTVKYAAADGALLWERRYNSYVPFGPGSDFGVPSAAALTVDGTGSVIVTGPSLIKGGGFFPAKYDYYTAKYAGGDGALLWEKSYNGPAHHDSVPSEIALDRNGNVVVTATSENDYHVAKYAAAGGALVWEKRGPGEVSHVAVDDSGSVVITGYSYDWSGSEDNYYTCKYAANGELLWERRGPGGDTRAVLDLNGNVVVTGRTSVGILERPEYYTAKFAALDGALLWEKRYSGPGNLDIVRSVAVDNHGNVAVTGSSAASVLFNSRKDYYTAKYAASDGALLWEKRYDGAANSEDAGRAVAIDGDGNVVVIGLNATLKYAAADGALLWVKRYSGTHALAMDNMGNVMLTGSYGTYKVAAADGALLWARRGPGEFRNVAVDDSGNVVVTGDSNQGNTSLYTAKYAAADGALLWEKRYSEGAEFWDQTGLSYNLALGPKGLVAITGRSILRTTGAEDVLTIVYREGLPPLAVEMVPAGVSLRFAGIKGQSYVIERATAVTGPWQSINTQTAPASGLLEYLDTTPHPGSSFYRTVQR